MEKQESTNTVNLNSKSNPKASQSQGQEVENESTMKDELYPEQIREAQGDIADRANIEIDQELQEQIMRARESLDPSRQHYKESR